MSAEASAKVTQVRIEALNEIECALFCITELAKTIKPSELSMLSDVVTLIKQLPET